VRSRSDLADERQLVEAQRLAQIGSWEWRLDVDEVTWSAELYRIFGLDPDHFQPSVESYIEHVHPADRDGVRAIGERIRSETGSTAAHHRVVRADGVQRVVYVRGDAVLDEDGRPVRVFGTVQDVTEQRGAEERLARSEQQLAEAQQLAHLGSWEWTADENRVTGSRELGRMMGIPEGTAPLDYRDALTYVHAEDRDRVDETLRVAVERMQATFSLEFRIVRPDGEVRELQSRASVERDADGRVRRVFGTHQDITELRQSERALRRAERRFRELLDAAPDLIVGIDAAGRVVLTNAALERLTGYRADEVIGRHAADMTPESARSEYIRRHGEFFAGREPSPSQGEFVIRRKDGSEFHCEVTFSRLDAEEGLLAVASIRDVSERREAQATRRKLEGRLRQAERLESVGQLAGGIAHDFNNLLAVILNYAAFVRGELPPNHPLCREVVQIEQAAHRAAELTRQLLIFARREIAAPEPLDLNRALGAAMPLIRRAVGDSVEVDVALEEQLWPVLADAGEVEQVLLNLAVNARDAMPGGGRLEIATANVAVGRDELPAQVGSGPGRHVRLRVADTGTGMAREVAERAFEPFFTTKAPGGGTGLGLASVYGIVKQAGGHIELRSEPGAGTEATLFLPAVDVPATAASSEGQPRP
jgi:PAS domain S-box-containing protein